MVTHTHACWTKHTMYYFYIYYTSQLSGLEKNLADPWPGWRDIERSRAFGVVVLVLTLEETERRLREGGS